MNTCKPIEQNAPNFRNDLANLPEAVETNRRTTLEFQVLFAEGEDELCSRDIPRINFLSDYLKNKPLLVVRLDGHADGRGTDEYNNVLAYERSKSIEDALLKRGIDKSRIKLFSHGSRFALLSDCKGTFERRVDIMVYSETYQPSGDIC